MMSPFLPLSKGREPSIAQQEGGSLTFCGERSLSCLINPFWIRSYLVNVSANYKNTFKHLFPYTSLSSDVVNKLECLCISLEIVFVDAHELCYP